MSLESLLARLAAGVTDVTGVQASNGAASGCYIARSRDVTDVTLPPGAGSAVTPVTPRNPADVTARPAPVLACTPVTPVTPRIDETANAASRHWRIACPDGRSIDLILSDPLTRSEVLAIRPGATGAEPIAPATPPATEAEAAELRRLVHAVLADAGDRDEAMRAGLADIEAALMCFRALANAAGAGSPDEPTDMRSCHQCAAFAGGHCRQAAQGVPLGFPVPRQYRPTMPDRAQRCAGYLPRADDPDQRTGAQHWPWLLRPTKGNP